MPTGVYKRQHHWTDRIQVGGDDECWLWLGSLDTRGYPQVNLGGSLHRAHRLVAEMHYGTITGPVHHTCENKRCLNPRHLQPLADASEHGLRHRRILCKNGHDLTDPMNVTYLSRGERRCRPCHARRERERSHRV